LLPNTTVLSIFIIVTFVYIIVVEDLENVCVQYTFKVPSSLYEK